MSDLLARLGAQRRDGEQRRHTHKYQRVREIRDGEVREFHECRCGAVRDEATARRNRNNRGRGLAIQRNVLREMGLEHIAGNKPNHDGRSSAHVAEVKSGARFSETRWDNVTRIPADAGQARWLVEVETPGGGRKARALVTTTLEDWLRLFGPPSTCPSCMGMGCTDCCHTGR